MAFKDDTPRLEIVDLSLIDADPRHIRKSIPDEALTGLTNAVRKLGLIQPLVVRPADGNRYQVIAGERRRLAALQAGETTVPVIVRSCSDDEALEVRVFENIGLGVRSALEPRDMANAIQAIALRFASPEEAAQYFGRAPTWLAQATAAAKLSEKVSALLDSGKISSTGTAVQLEKLARKNEAKAESLIEQIEQLPEGKKLSRKIVDNVLSEASGRPRKVEAAAAAPVEASAAGSAESPVSAGETPPWEEFPAESPVAAPSMPASPAPAKASPNKIKLVAELLGLSEEDEETLLARLIDEFLATRNA